jgi:hypothetical protein
LALLASAGVDLAGLAVDGVPLEKWAAEFGARRSVEFLASIREKKELGESLPDSKRVDGAGLRM